jgi:hypothetical protein
MRTWALAAIESVNVWTSNDLPRARLAADEDEMSEAEARLCEQVLEARELVVTLQHSNHVRMIPWPRATEIRVASPGYGARKMAARVGG